MTSILGCGGDGSSGVSSPRVVAIVQVRLGSTRLPNKVLAELGGQPALRLLLNRLGRARLVDEIVVATTINFRDGKLEELVQSWGYQVVRGSEQDVLSRYVLGVRRAHADVVVRITGDCPFVDPTLVDQVVSDFLGSGAEYGATSGEFPDGFDIQVTTRERLLQAQERATDRFDREHVMPWIIRTASTTSIVPCHGDYSDQRVTLDEPEDLIVLRNVVDYFGRDDFCLEEVTALMDARPDLFEANRHLVCVEGSVMSMGEKLWRRAKRVIPGGNMLLSKRAEQFLPMGWPAYFSRSKGCEVWDLDGNRYLDVGYMGIGTNILGYGHPAVDDAVRGVINAGNMSTLNCPEEVTLAERLCELHPWANMVKLARSGGEACAIAVRIARAATGKPAVAVCGYHGWHDWYLSANLADDAALDGHLLPGLTPNGVPRNLQGLTRPFSYNDIEALRSILQAGDVGVVMMEVERSAPPAQGFLQEVRDLATSHGCALIFDECTSGFRKNLGGLHLVYGIEPDIATFGKTLGNGYAITAVAGRQSVMDAANSTFISSTFWTERIGPTAAVATLAAMDAEDAPCRIDAIGLRVREIWRSAAAELGLSVTFTGVPSLTKFSIEGWDPTSTRLLITAAMLERGFLAGPAVYASIAHDDNVLEQYAEALRGSLRVVAAKPSVVIAPPDQTTLSDFGRLA